MEQTCCLDCTERHKHCHSECSKYIEWKREHDIKVAKLRKAHELDIEVDLYRAKRRVKMQRLKGRVK